MSAQARRCLAAAAALTVLVGLAVGPSLHPAVAQSQGPASPPLVPLFVGYTQWDGHVMQWLENHPRFGMVEALIREREGGPLIWLFFTETDQTGGSARQVHYVNDERWADAVRSGALDREVHVAEIAYSRTESDKGDVTLKFAFQTEDGAVTWEFLAQGQPTVERARKLVDTATTPEGAKGGLLFLYLGKSAIADRTTRLRVDNAVYPATVWREVSDAPRFVGYHGVYSTDVRMARIGAVEGSFPFGTPPVSAPPADVVPAQPQEPPPVPVLTPAEGEGGEAVYNAPGVVVRAALKGGQVRPTALTASDRGGGMTLTFSPALPDVARAADGEWTSDWVLSLGDVADVTTGQVKLTKTGREVKVALLPGQPKWWQTVALEATLRVQDDGYAYRSAVVGRSQEPQVVEAPAEQAKPAAQQAPQQAQPKPGVQQAQGKPATPAQPQTPEAPPAAPQAAAARRMVSDFESGKAVTDTGLPWQTASDVAFGGTSKVQIEVVAGGAHDSAHSLKVSGNVVQRTFAFFGCAMFNPGTRQGEVVDMSRYSQIVFMTKGTGKIGVVMVFTRSRPGSPVSRQFSTTDQWERRNLGFADLKVPLDEVTGIGFGCNLLGTFEFQIDDVELR